MMGDRENDTAAGLKSATWLLLDTSGHEVVWDADKYAIMQRVQIHARDLRILDPLLSYPSTILGRERAIVLNLEHIKAIITADEVLLRDPSDDNVVPVAEALRKRMATWNREDHKDPATPNDVETSEEDDSLFEFIALEVALEAICSYLAAQTMELETAVYPALDMLTSKISSRNLDRVRKLKSQMTRLIGRVQKIRDELEQLLDDDDDMDHLYLSRKLVIASPASNSCGANWLSRASTRASMAAVHGEENDVEDLEMLLEAYFMQIDSTFNKLATLREYIGSTEDYINIQLDNHRNQLIKLEVFLNSASLCLTIWALVAGLLGVNIPFSWNQNHGYMFKWVVIITSAGCALLFTFTVGYARYKGLV